jgi:hypothetical protein
MSDTKAADSNGDDATLYVRMASALVPVNLDSDGTPLSLHGERMIEIEPGKWVDPLIAAVIGFYAQHPQP